VRIDVILHAQRLVRHGLAVLLAGGKLLHELVKDQRHAVHHFIRRNILLRKAGVHSAEIRLGRTGKHGLRSQGIAIDQGVDQGALDVQPQLDPRRLRRGRIGVLLALVEKIHVPR